MVRLIPEIKNTGGFFTLPMNLDILGLVFASIVFFCGFYRLSHNNIMLGSVRTIELIGIICAGIAIFLMWYHFNRGIVFEDELHLHELSPT